MMVSSCQQLNTTPVGIFKLEIDLTCSFRIDSSEQEPARKLVLPEFDVMPDTVKSLDFVLNVLFDNHT
jgi:hypothetical protein